MSEQKQSGFSVFVNKRILPPVMKFVNTKAIQALQNGISESCKQKTTGRSPDRVP